MIFDQFPVLPGLFSVSEHVPRKCGDGPSLRPPTRSPGWMGQFIAGSPGFDF